MKTFRGYKTCQVQYEALEKRMSVPIAVILSLSVLCVAAGKEITVDPDCGNDVTCVKTAAPTVCSSLERVQSLVGSSARDITITIIRNSITLNSTFRVANTANFTLKGNDSAALVRIVCTTQQYEAGFVFEEIHGLKLLNVEFHNCSLKRKIREFKETYHFAMLIERCTELILLQNIHFLFSRKTALLLINNVGEVVMDGASFVHNNLERRRNVTQLYPGAVSIIQYHYNKPNNTTVNYSITRSSFCNNRVTRVHLTKLPYDPFFENRGYGGAVFILLGNYTSNSTVTISKSSFSFNRGVRGAGVYAFFTGTANNSSVIISETEFNNNRAILSGGGVNLGFVSSRNNAFEVRRCNFTSNQASSGAGLTLYSTHNDENSGQRVIVSDCRWYKNKGDVSSAVDVAPVFEDERSWGYLPIPEFHNCFFSNNVLHKTTPSYYGSKTSHINTGVVGITRFKVQFGGNTTFQYNKYTAVMILSGVMEFLNGSNTTFHKNYGYNGGAIAMYGHSTLKLHSSTTLRFRANYAFNHGGAIYHYTYDQRSFLYGTDSACFFQISKQANHSTIRVSFVRNNATVGTAIYTNTFQSCAHKCSANHSLSNLTYDNIFECIGSFTFQKHNHRKSLMTGAGASFNFTSLAARNTCKDLEKSKICTMNTQGSSFVCEAIPGDQICLPFVVLDDFGQVIQPMLRISKTRKGKYNVSMREVYSSTNRFCPVGEPGTKKNRFMLRVNTVNSIFFYFNVSLLPCPPGYHINTSTGHCACASGESGYKAVLNCIDSTFQAHSTSNVWAGYIHENSEDLYFAPCAFPVCETAGKTAGLQRILPNKSAELNNWACPANSHRQGILCGSCPGNYSMLYHSQSFSCKEDKHCFMGPLLYLLSEIVPMVTFFAVVVTFDLSFTSGRAVGFVFFAQHATTLTLYTGNKKVLSYLQIPYKILYGLFSFEFFEVEQLKFCLWKGAGMLDVIAFKYVTMTIALLLVLSLVLLMHCNCCRKLWQVKRRISAKTSVVHGLSAFLVICYSQCTKISQHILWFVHPVGYNMTLADHKYSYYGGQPYFQGKHLVYAVPALVFLVFVTVIPPLVLLLYPLSLHLLSLCGLSEHWLVNKTLRLTGIHKLMPFIDCFQSCYKDKLRFFAGLYFVYRVAILLVQNKNHGNIEAGIFSELALVGFVCIHALFQPYKRRLHNMLDALAFFNLAAINGCTLVSNWFILQLDYRQNSKLPETVTLLSYLQLLLLYLPLLVLLGGISRVAFLRLKLKCCGSPAMRQDDLLDYSQRKEEEEEEGSLRDYLSKDSYGSIG